MTTCVYNSYYEVVCIIIVISPKKMAMRLITDTSPLFSVIELIKKRYLTTTLLTELPRRTMQMPCEGAATGIPWIL